MLLIYLYSHLQNVAVLFYPSDSLELEFLNISFLLNTERYFAEGMDNPDITIMGWFKTKAGALKGPWKSVPSCPLLDHGVTQSSQAANDMG